MSLSWRTFTQKRKFKCKGSAASAVRLYNLPTGETESAGSCVQQFSRLAQVLAVSRETPGEPNKNVATKITINEKLLASTRLARVPAVSRETPDEPNRIIATTNQK